MGCRDVKRAVAKWAHFVAVVVEIVRWFLVSALGAIAATWRRRPRVRSP